MRNIRSLFFGCLTIFALGMLIYQTWLSALLSPAAPVPTEQGPNTAAHTDVPPSEPAPLAADKAATPVDSIPGDPLVLMQSKLFVGADLWTKNLYKMRGDQPTASDTQAMTMFVKSVQSSVHEVVKLDEPLGGVSSPAYRDSLRKKIVLGTYFDLLQATEPMLERLTTDSARTAEEIEFDAGFRTVVASLLRPEDATLAYERQSLATAQWGQFEQSLGWFGKLLRFKAGSLTPEDTTKFEEENHTRFGKFLSGLTTFATILSVGVVGFLIYSFRFFTGRSRFALDPPSMSPNFCLEIFCLYLLAMLGLSFVFRLAAGMRTEIVERLGGPGMLMLNCIGILSTVLIVFWPRLWGVSVRSTFSTIGLTFGGVGRFFGNLVIGPTFYISAWIPLLAVLIVYSIIIQWFGIDMSKGAHPVIPILLSSEDKEARFFIIFLAVVVAPFVEEIMFRGAFYSWLRSRMGRLSSMLVCSIVFASIHPQGLLGLVPLTCVSMVLCMLREWRQSLVAPMLAHACFNAGTLSMVFLMFGD